jgi:uncharacterized membrane protein
MDRQQLTMLGGVGLGAALMYAFDPDRGKRRRAGVRDKLVSATDKAADAVSATARDLRNRARGLYASSMSPNEKAADQVLVARVRSKMGRVVSHPSAIEVSADQGRIALKGPILAHELNDLLTSVAKIPDVERVDNQLELHKQAGDLPALQGGTKRVGDRFELMQENWSPTARLLTGAAGGAAIVYGLSRRNPLCLLAGTVGAGLLLRGITNLELKRLTGISAGRRAVEIQKDINIAARVERVYEFWSNVQNFPMFMTNVQEVRATGEGGSHWKVNGPAGVPVEWEAIITEQIPNKLLAWKSVEGASVANAGIVRFDRNDDGTTRLEVKLSYNPPGGAIGHALAALLGADPKRQMDEDLVRMKTLIETGNPPHDAARPDDTRSREAMVY